MSEQSHYEVLSQSGGGWNVEAIVPESDEATERAHDVKRLKGSDAIKVVRVSFNNAAGEFREQEILFLGTRRSPVKKYSDGLDAGSPCRSLEHLYSFQSRQAIRRVMRQWLDANRITPVELLHHPEYINRFEGSGSMLQSAVQRAAMAQASAHNQEVKARQRELYDLVDKASAKARMLWRTEKCPVIHDDDLDTLVGSLAEEKDKDYLFNAAVTNWLRQYETAPEKFIALLELAIASKKPAATAHLDGYLADFFEDAGTIGKLIGDQKNLGDAVLRLAELINPGSARPPAKAKSAPVAPAAGNAEAGDGSPKVQGEIYDDSEGDSEEIPEHPVMEQFRAVMRRGRFPRCRQALVRRIEQTLTGPRSLSGDGALADSQLLRQLYDRLCDEEGNFIMGSDLEDAFVERSQGYVSGNSIGQMLEGVELPLKRVAILLKAEKGIFGKSSRQRVGDYILAVLKEPENQAGMRNPEKAPAVHMRDLGGVQRLIADSSLAEAQKEEASEVLDDICSEILEKGQILAKIADRSSNSIDECLSILKLCAAGTFTEGRAADLARQRASKVLRSPGFAEAFLRRGTDKAEMQKMLVELESLMSQAGIGDLGPMGAMVAAQA